MTRLLLFAFAALNLKAHSAQTEVMWVKFHVNRTYNDADVKCSGTTAIGQLLLSAEVKDGTVKNAQLQNFPLMFPFKAIHSVLPLSNDEVKAIRVLQDSRGFRWVTALSLSEPSLRWALFESARRYSFCKPPQPLASVTPNGATLEFETEGIEEGIWLAESNKILVSGTRKDGLAFSGSIQITQKEYRNGL